ncbi:hypothetical protein ACFYY8_31475 [Streptosporangium sp. NPDC001559]|uniref:hypothetical protein n=1 Tax=Streptosporangium sp. NPDC001559 TaxID=3366187 RepID=UPI0036ECD1A6
MIPHDRATEVTDAEGVAELLGMSYKTFRNKGGGAAFGLQPFEPSRRKLLFDRAQAEALAADRPPPPRPASGGEHPDDLLDEQDVAQALDITYATVRKDRSAGRLGDDWTDVCGVAHIRRATLHEVVKARPGRGVGGGRPRKVKAEDR